MSTFYKQCKFKKGNATQTAWIEEHSAVLGKIVELKSDNREKWEVIEVGEHRHDSPSIHTWQM